MSVRKIAVLAPAAPRGGMAARTLASAAAGRERCDPATFETHVVRRLDIHGGEFHGPGYERPVGELIGEAIEEAADLAAWLRVASFVLRDRDDLPRQKAAAALRFRRATAQAQAAWQELRDALAIIESKEEK